MSSETRALSQRWLDLGDQQRAAVSRAAVDLVSEGATPLKVADLADRAGISRPTFYKYFPTLGAAVLHTTHSLLAELEAFVHDFIPQEANAREQLLARFSASFEFARSHPEVTRFFSYHDFSFRGTGFSREEEEMRTEQSHEAGNPFLELFRAGQADGSIDAALPIDVTYLALVSSMTGTSQQLLIETKWTTGTDERARLVHETLIDVWRQALAPKDHS